MKKRILSLILAMTMICALALPAAAHDMGKAGQRNVISCGSRHTAAIDENGALWMWGENMGGQLGNGGGGNVKDKYDRYSQTVPTKVLDDVLAVSCGGNHTAALKTDGTLWMWGENSNGQLGNGGEKGVKDPIQVLDNVSAVSCGEYHTAAIKTDGTLWVWGLNSGGQLGNGTTESSRVPIKVMDNVAAVGCGGWYTAAIQTDGTLWTWGENSSGQLGSGSTEGSNVPIKVLDNVSAVSCSAHTAALKTDGTLWMWGNNSRGELGNDSEENFAAPIKVMDNIAAVSCGGNYTAAIQTDGTLWTWGYNCDGQLGNGNRKNSTTPIKVLDNVAAVSCGTSHTAAIRTDGAVWTWGDNNKGQLGNGGGGNDFGNNGGKAQNVPTQIDLKAALAPAAMTAYASTQSVLVDGTAVVFQCYALKDASGFDTNYIKLRDVASILNGTAAQFSVGWDGTVNIETGKGYTPNGSEMTTPFSGNRAYTPAAAPTKVNGKEIDIDAIVLKDDQGGAYTYYKLRDLGAALGFTVDWSAEKGICIETK